MAKQTQAQARQRLIYQLDSIGSDPSSFELADVLTPGEQALGLFIERVKGNLNSADMIVTGNIAEMSVQVREDGLYLTGNKYLLYQDRGVQGSLSSAKAPESPHKYTDKMPPLQVFIDYIKQKNINLANQAQFFEGESPFKDLSEDEKIERVARLMQISVFRYGFKPRNVFAKEIPQLKTDLKKALGSAIALKIKENFK